MLIHHLPRAKVFDTQLSTHHVRGVALRPTSLRGAPRSIPSTQFPTVQATRSPSAPPLFPHGLQELAVLRLPPTFSLQLCQIGQAASFLFPKRLLFTQFLIHDVKVLAP